MKKIFTLITISISLLASAQKVVETYEDGKLVKREVYDSNKPDKDFTKGLEISGLTHLNSEGFGATSSIDWHTGGKDGMYYGIYYEAFASLNIDDYVEGGGNFHGYGINIGAMFNSSGQRNLYGGFSLGTAPSLYYTNRGNSIETKDAFAFGLTLKYRYKNLTPQIKFIVIDSQDLVSGFGLGYIF